MTHNIAVLQIGQDRWIAFDDGNDYIGTGQTGWAAVGDLVSRCAEYYDLRFTFPSITPEGYNSVE